MTISLISASDPVYGNAEGTHIILSCLFSHFPTERMDFRATLGDTEAHGRGIFARANAEEFGVVAPYIPPPAPILSKQQRIDAIEAGQDRAVREVALGMPGAVARLQVIDDQIAAIRALP